MTNIKEFKGIIDDIIQELKNGCVNFLNLSRYKFGCHTDFISHLINHAVKLGFYCYPEAVKTNYYI